MTLLIVRSVLRGGRAVAVGLAMAGAVALVDVLYGTLGLGGDDLDDGELIHDWRSLSIRGYASCTS